MQFLPQLLNNKLTLERKKNEKDKTGFNLRSCFHSFAGTRFNGNGSQSLTNHMMTVNHLL